MNKTLSALVLAFNVPLLHAQATGKQTEFTSPPPTRGSGISRADDKAQERAEYKQAKKASASGLKASRQRYDAEKNLDVPR